MSQVELNEEKQIRLMVNHDTSSGYLRAKSANVEVTILEGNDIICEQGELRKVVGHVTPSDHPATTTHFVIK